MTTAGTRQGQRAVWAQRLLANVEAGLADVVVVSSADRLTRSCEQAAQIARAFGRHNVTCIFLNRAKETTR